MVRVYPWIVGLLVIALLTPALAGGAVPSESVGRTGTVAGSSTTTVVTAPPQTDTTITRIEVRSTSDARWSIQLRTRLDTEDDIEAYRSFQRRFQENTSRFRAPFTRRMRGIVSNAANATGRSMTVRKVTATTSIQETPQQWGVVTFSFTWTNFARQEGETLVVGDVFEGGFSLGTNDTLDVTAPSGYDITAVEPSAAERTTDSVSWAGRKDFADGRPQVHIEPASSTSPTGTADDTGLLRNVGAPGFSILGAVGGLVAAGYLHRWRRQAGYGAPP